MSRKIFIGYSTAHTLSPNTTLTDFALIIQDITNNFSIKRGEKLENPNFGTIIPFLLFEPFNPDTVAAIEDEVEKVINFDPRCKLTAVGVTQNIDESGITVTCAIDFVPFSVSGNITWTMNKDGSIYMTS